MIRLFELVGEVARADIGPGGFLVEAAHVVVVSVPRHIPAGALTLSGEPSPVFGLVGWRQRGVESVSEVRLVHSRSSVSRRGERLGRRHPGALGGARRLHPAATLRAVFLGPAVVAGRAILRLPGRLTAWGWRGLLEVRRLRRWRSADLTHSAAALEHPARHRCFRVGHGLDRLSVDLLHGWLGGRVHCPAPGGGAPAPSPMSAPGPAGAPGGPPPGGPPGGGWPPAFCPGIVSFSGTGGTSRIAWASMCCRVAERTDAGRLLNRRLLTSRLWICRCVSSSS